MEKVNRKISLATDLFNHFDYISFVSLIISLMAVSVTLLRYKKESKRQRQADLVSTLTDIVNLIDNDRAIKSRGILRKNELLNSLRLSNENEENEKLINQLDTETEAAARYVATTYDRLGFILKHDKDLEDEVLRWHGYVIADMWLLIRQLIKKKWRKRNSGYMKEFERLGQKALKYGDGYPS